MAQPFVIGASIKTARDRGVIKPGEFTILFPEYIEELQRRFLRLESEARDDRYHSALHCLEMLNERSAEYGRGMEMARGNTPKLLIAVGIQFTLGPTIMGFSASPRRFSSMQAVVMR